MKELIKKMLDAGNTEALNSLEAFKAAAMDLGYTEKQVQETLENCEGFPLDDEDLEEISGGTSVFRGVSYINITN